ncbi:MAG TPA: O-methyltransferase [Pseudonocardiaceae bacterium]
MTQEQWTAVDDYLTELVVRPGPELSAVEESAAAAGLPAIAVAPNEGKLLRLLAKLAGARSILEIGTLAGYSTIWLAGALPEGGSLVTLEIDPRHAEVARANIERAGLADRVEVRVGAALDSLPALATEGRGPFDMVFIDADKEGNPDYFRWALQLSRPGALIVVDNVVREGAVVEDTGRSDIQGTRRVLELMAAEPRVSVTVIQTVGRKGHDGMAIALVLST